jgi:hypothetical protein
MRQPHEAAGAASYTVSVTPALHEVSVIAVCLQLLQWFSSVVVALIDWTCVLECAEQQLHAASPAPSCITAAIQSHNSEVQVAVVRCCRLQDASVDDKLAVEEHLTLRCNM